MKTMKKALALVLALCLLMTLAACGKKDKGGDTTSTTTTTTVGDSDSTTTSATTTTTTTLPTDDSGLLPDTELDGTADHPFEIGGALEFDAVVKAGGVTYYDVYRVDGTTLTLKSKDATVEYEGKVYEPKNGVISFPVSTDDILNPVKLIIRNTGKADATFHVTFAYPIGTLLNPYELAAGNLTTKVAAGNETGVVYLYTATKAGTLSFAVQSANKGVNYDVEMYNLTSGANRTLEEDGTDGKVSVAVAVGDQVRVTVLVLPNDKNEYPAATIKSVVVLDTGDGNAADDTKKETTYTVTVKDKQDNLLQNVKLQFNVGGKKVSATTNAKGVAKATLPTADGTVTITVPTGYIAEKFTYTITSASPALTIVLEKEQLEPPAPPTKPTTPGTPTQPEITTMDYSVTLLDGKGAPLGGLTVLFFSGDKQVAKQVGDKKGVSKVTLDRGTYTVKVEGTDLLYDQKAAVVSVNNPSLNLILTTAISTSKTYKLVVTQPDGTDRTYKVPYLSEGAAYVTLVPGERNYFMFEPKRGGTFRLSASNTYAKIGHFGTDMFVYQTNSADVSGNAFNISVREAELGNIYVIGIDAATNCSAAVLQVTRVGDPAWSIEDVPTEEYTGAAPKPITAPSGLVDLDIKSATEHHLVYNSKDGYYHLDSTNGPVVYVRMDNPYASLVGMLKEYGSMIAIIYNADGSLKSKEQYAVLMQQYINNMDKTQQVYPLTKDLKYMIENYGNCQNWWNEGEPGYLFEEVEGVNPASAWMFLYCYKK